MIKTLCGDVGAATGRVDDGVPLVYYAADPGRTALEHVARLAGWSGTLARFGADGKLEATVVGATPDVALRNGREVLRFEANQAAAPLQGFVVAGEAGAGSASAPEAQRPTTDFFGGSRPPGPSAEQVWRWEPALRTAAAARTAGAALDRRYDATRKGATIQTLLAPALRPGTVLEVQDLPDGMDGGALWADRVTHRLSAGTASTTARVWQASAAAGLF
jgi:hypothetical protein